MKRSVKLVFGALGTLALPILAGCGGGGGSSPTPITPVAPLPHSVSAALPNGLTATVAEDRTSVPVGGVVTYTMTLTNNTAQPITFRPVFLDGSPSSGVGDRLTVKDAGGKTAFPQTGSAQVITTGPSSTLAPGKSLSGTLAVGNSKDTGQFSTTGKYTSTTQFAVQAGPDASIQASSTPVTVTVGPLEVDAQ